ncbi:MAG: hypothetical protein HPY53_12895 [Brevinematales bacterium]|nr:hypothetical protein [Brevinematales bacterium]
MGDFKVEKVTDVPGYSAKQTKRKKSLVRVALAILSGLIIGSVGGCVFIDDVPTGGTYNPLKIKFDFSGTFNPETYGVLPFLVGDINEVIMGTSDWGWTGNINAAGVKGADAVAMLTKEYDGTWSIILAPTNNNIAWGIAFRAANYLTSEWTAVTNDFWNNIGMQLTGVNNEQIFISNNMIIGVQKPVGVLTNFSNTWGSISFDGFYVSWDHKTVTIDVGAHGGWSICTGDPIDMDINVTIIWTNIPAWNHNPTKIVGWLPLLGLVSNTNTGATTAVIPTITGGAGFLHTNGVATWDPKQGNPVTINAGLKTAYVTFTVPSGSAQTFEFKMANTNGWDSGEEANNQFCVMPLGVTSYTQTVNFSKSSVYLP